MPDVVSVDNLSHSYAPARGQKERRVALKDLTFRVQEGELFCFLGPNGSGKSTLFRILSTFLTPAEGRVSLLGFDVREARMEIRRRIGVVFQSPSLDKKLTARENLLHQGHLYGLRGVQLEERIRAMLSETGVLDRMNDLVEELSGGMQRRVELAKALLHKPRLLILDEPSTGLDPGARMSFGEFLADMRKREDVTVLLTTHILDEAERCDRIAILDQGTLVGLGEPKELKKEIGGDVVAVTTDEPLLLRDMIQERFGGSPTVLDRTIRIERANGHEFIPGLVQSFPGRISSVSVSKPTLEDVFIHKTGHRFWENGHEGPPE